MSYPPQTPSRGFSAASGRPSSSSGSASSQSTQHNTGIRLVPYTPPKALDDNRSHRSSIGSQFSTANVVIEGETQLELDRSAISFGPEHSSLNLQAATHSRRQDHHENDDADDEDFSDASSFNSHKRAQQRRRDFYNQKRSLMPSDTDLSFSLTDDMDMDLDVVNAMESSNPSFRPASSSWHTSELLGDETVATETSISSHSFLQNAPGQRSQLHQVSELSIPRPGTGSATSLAPAANRRPYKHSAWTASAVHSDSEDSAFDSVADLHANTTLEPSLEASASNSFGLDLPPLPLPPFAPSGTPSASRSRQSSFGSENLRPSTAGGKKRRNQLMISSDGKTFSLAPLSPTTASSSFAPAPLNAHLLKASTFPSDAVASSHSVYTRSNSVSSSQSLSNASAPRPLPLTPVTPSTSASISASASSKSASTVAAIPIPASANSTAPSIRAISASANSVLSSSFESATSNTIRPVFDTNRLSSSAYSLSTAPSRSTSSQRRYSEETSFVDTRATTPSESLFLSPTYSFHTKGKAAVIALEADQYNNAPSAVTSPTSISSSSSWGRMIGGVRQVTTEPKPIVTSVSNAQLPVTVAHFTLDPVSVDLESPVSGPDSPSHKDSLFVAKRNSASSQKLQTAELQFPTSHALQSPVFRELHEKSSFQSETTLSETSNYKVYARSSSPPAPEDDTISLAPSYAASLDSNTNVQIIGQSSPVASVSRQFEDSNIDLHHRNSEGTITYSSDDDENFVVHNVSSPPQSLPSSPIEPQQSRFRNDNLEVSKRTVQPVFSQESLRVEPLRPLVKVTPASRPLSACSEAHQELDFEELHHAPSAESLNSAFSFEPVESLLATPTAIHLRRASLLELSASSASNSTHDLLQPSTMSHPSEQWAEYNGSPSSSAGPSDLEITPIQAHPHKWSDQLSTVMSVTEPSSSAPHSPISRTGSIGSFATYNRHSVGYASSAHSRRMPSISSSIAVNMESNGSSSVFSHSRSNSASVERPTPTYQRTSGANVINHVDEYGDGIGELNTLHSRPSRTRLGSLFSGTSSDRNLHSSSSSRSNSMNSASIPTWARLYYANGEPRPMVPTSDPSDPESRPTSRLGRVASSEFLPFGRRKQRPSTPESAPRTQTPLSQDGSYTQSQGTASRGRGGSIRAQIRKQTSSIWSPHLRQDRRAIVDRHSSMWDPPTVVWSSGSSFISRRNIQVVSFILGFIFPFAWMIAAFIPLPAMPSSVKTMEEGRSSMSDGALEDDIAISQLHSDEVYHLRMYEGARWWRRLNRYMSAVGLLVIGAVVALIIIGVQ